ncbi:uncharacterized protein CTHT_0049140 [Thermochaetoides thermophila DSM 1495]|uniref:Secreted protein n=1 Tax=Chaetomium thermophilum (strain DSM 1495 / CBS 144.50 / IMI 039719) TaxID=759272 RepID=G0SB73_CHATD|nr:hypothetical protein CTHT_0049140 [Thermochaetoides thermophila DSM 1495]EGS19453.1 hypothetical protein CTHT_0049140 [Thermochaetoides thermophila DSM 1495]
MRAVSPSSTLFVAALTTLLSPVHSSPLKLLPRAPSPPTALPQNATLADLQWQPSLDFDTDGCYNVPAIGPDGTIAQGLPHHFTGYATDCRDASDLDNNNVYVRNRCNSGWCIHLYGYYFEKDVAIKNFLDTGHTHDWEHIAVWVRQETGQAEYVGASQHGNYEIRHASSVRWDGTHPKMVYHKDGAGTHCFRFANAADDNIENHKGVWFRGALVSYNGFPSETLREKLFAHDFGAATISIKNSTFPNAITKAKPTAIAFDVNLDVGSPGWPGQ